MSITKNEVRGKGDDLEVNHEDMWRKYYRQTS